jgi:transketolase N-terminal domain/subunit
MTDNKYRDALEWISAQTEAAKNGHANVFKVLATGEANEGKCYEAGEKVLRHIEILNRIREALAIAERVEGMPW